jgi:single-strand DNA-binding protein
MASVNTITISGRLGADPELRQTQGGDSVTSLRMAVDAGKDQTLWLSVTAWGRLAELSNEFLSKGSYAVVTGKLVDDSYTNKEGINVNRVAVKAFSIDFGPRMGDGQQSSKPQAQAQPQAQQPAFTDPLPF